MVVRYATRMLIPDDFRELTRAKNPFDSQIKIALLQEAGIPAMGESDGLQDEIAVSHRLMNTAGVRVFVPEARLEDARDVLRAAKEAGDRMRSEFPEDDA